MRSWSLNRLSSFKTPLCERHRDVPPGRTGEQIGKDIEPIGETRREADVEKRSRDRGKHSILQGLAAQVSQAKIGQNSS
jgi:hypothetical protein